MKVKELISKLQKINPDAEVIGYNSYTNDDYLINGVEAISKLTEENRHYCQGDSEAEMLLGKPVVYLIDRNIN